MTSPPGRRRDPIDALLEAPRDGFPVVGGPPDDPRPGRMELGAVPSSSRLRRSADTHAAGGRSRPAEPRSHPALEPAPRDRRPRRHRRARRLATAGPEAHATTPERRARYGKPLAAPATDLQPVGRSAIQRGGASGPAAPASASLTASSARLGPDRPGRPPCHRDAGPRCRGRSRGFPIFSASATSLRVPNSPPTAIIASALRATSTLRPSPKPVVTTTVRCRLRRTGRAGQDADGGAALRRGTGRRGVHDPAEPAAHEHGARPGQATPHLLGRRSFPLGGVARADHGDVGGLRLGPCVARVWQSSPATGPSTGPLLDCRAPCSPPADVPPRFHWRSTASPLAAVVRSRSAACTREGGAPPTAPTGPRDVATSDHERRVLRLHRRGRHRGPAHVARAGASHGRERHRRAPAAARRLRARCPRRQPGTVDRRRRGPVPSGEDASFTVERPPCRRPSTSDWS